MQCLRMLVSYFRLFSFMVVVFPLHDAAITRDLTDKRVGINHMTDQFSWIRIMSKNQDGRSNLIL